MAKLSALNWRDDSSELKTNTGWLPRCHDSATDMRGKKPERAALILASRFVAGGAGRPQRRILRQGRLHRLLERQRLLRRGARQRRGERENNEPGQSGHRWRDSGFRDW